MLNVIRNLRVLINRLIIKAYKGVSVGSRFNAINIPMISIDQGGLVIGDNVTIGQGVEIRISKGANIFIGDNVKIDRGVRLLSTNNKFIYIGANTKIGLHCVFNGGDFIYLGDNCLVSGMVYFQTSMHQYNGDGPYVNQGYTHGEIYVGDNVWIGAQSMITPNTRVNSNAIIGFNSFVNKNVHTNTIVAGTPIDFVKQIKN